MEKFVDFILNCFFGIMVLLFIGVLGFFGYIGYQLYSVKDLPISYKDSVISQMIEVYHPEQTTTTYMNVNNISIPMQNTTPAYMSYEVALNGFTKHFDLNKNDWNYFYKGESVRVGYKVSSGGQTFFYTLDEKNKT